jgi:hypothetical protein
MSRAPAASEPVDTTRRPSRRVASQTGPCQRVPGSGSYEGRSVPSSTVGEDDRRCALRRLRHLFDHAGARPGFALPAPGLVHPQPAVILELQPTDTSSARGLTVRRQVDIPEAQDVIQACPHEKPQADCASPVPGPHGPSVGLVVVEDSLDAYVASVLGRHVPEPPTLKVHGHATLCPRGSFLTPHHRHGPSHMGAVRHPPRPTRVSAVRRRQGRCGPQHRRTGPGRHHRCGRRPRRT